MSNFKNNKLKLQSLKYLFLFFLSVFFSFGALAQLQPIDSSAIGKWPSVGNANVSNDGNFVCYIVYNLPLKSQTLVIRAVNNRWKREFVGATDPVFSDNNEKIIFKLPRDTLCILILGEGGIIKMPNVKSVKLHAEGKDEWIFYNTNSANNELVLRSLCRKEEKHFPCNTGYFIAENGRSIVIQNKERSSNSDIYYLELFTLSNKQAKKIWQGERVGDCVFDPLGNQIAFISKNQLWYYKVGMDSAIEWVTKRNLNKSFDSVKINKLHGFSKDGKKLFFSITNVNKTESDTKPANIRIWSYTDKVLQPDILNQINHSSEFEFVINVNESKAFSLTNDKNEKLIGGYKPLLSGEGKYALVESSDGDEHELNWNRYSKFSIYLINTSNGSRELILKNMKSKPWSFVLSPNGRFVVYYDQKLKNYFSYNIKDSVWTNVSIRIGVPLFDEENDRPDIPDAYGFGQILWLDNSSAFLVYDKFDIWQIDPLGKEIPVNITNGYGRTHNIIFRLASKGNELQDLYGTPEKETALLTAFDIENKYNGFYSIKLRSNNIPNQLLFGPYVYSWWNIETYLPIKAGNANVWIVKRMGFNDYPNFYLTKDFKKLTQLTNLQPQRNFNWMTAELIKWQTSEGIGCNGILYKPSNFDSSKKYPVIFYFYERLSQQLNKFIEPEYSTGPLNIPYFVSNGYIVFVPDVSFKIGKPGEGFYNSIVSAANFLSKKVWINADRMGIQGHSFGAYGVNYLITTTNLFAAAAAASGVSNFISGYGSLLYWGSAQPLYEVGQNRIGTTLWDNTDLYVKNSPILRANHVTTPLLLMSNKNDGAVPYSQGMELFTALRRLGKKVWMLEYTGEGHEVGGKNAQDYTLRLIQFFNHYLKGAAAPKWMLGEDSSNSNGITTELNTTGMMPGKGLLEDENNN